MKYSLFSFFTEKLSTVRAAEKDMKEELQEKIQQKQVRKNILSLFTELFSNKKNMLMMIFNGNYSILLNLKTKDDDNWRRKGRNLYKSRNL